jgi:hypothetical protein
MPMRALIAYLDVTLNDMMRSLYRQRQALMVMQQYATMNPTNVAAIGEALTSLHEAERTLAEIQRHIESVRGRR